MELDESSRIAEEKRLSRALGVGAMIEEPFGRSQAVVLDLDHMISQSLLHSATQLIEKSITHRQMVFAVWFPNKYPPAEAHELYEKFVNAGVYLIERTDKDEALLACWTRNRSSIPLDAAEPIEPGVMVPKKSSRDISPYSTFSGTKKSLPAQARRAVR